MIGRRIAVLILGASLFLPVACSTSGGAEEASETEATETSTAQTGQGSGTENKDGKKGQLCPMAVEGTSVEAKKVKGKVAMDYTTSGSVSEVRKRARARVKMQNALRKKMTQGDRKKRLAVSKVEYSKIDGGARITHWMPRVEKDQVMLYKSLSTKAQKMNDTQSCLMKTSHGGGGSGE